MLRRRETPLACACAIGLISLAIRLSVAITYAAHPIGRVPWVDEGSYLTRALGIVHGDWMPEIPFFQDPLYPYLLAAVMAIFGRDVGTLRIVFAVLGTLTPLVVFAAAYRGFGLAEAVLAGLITAFCGPLIFADVSLGKEGPAALAVGVAILIASCGTESRRETVRVLSASLEGLAWGAVALLRSNALLVGLLRLINHLCVKGSRRWRVATGFVAGFGLVMMPVVLVNRSVSDPPEWIIGTWQAGPNFFIGNNPEATGAYEAPEFVEANPAREANDFATEARRRTGQNLSYNGISRYWFHQGLTWWRDSPKAAFGLMIHKFGLLVHNAEIPDNQDPDFVRIVAAPGLSWGVVGLGMLAPLSVIGALSAWRSKVGPWIVAASAVGLGSTALFFVVGRYRVPWLPGLAILAGAGLVELARLAKRGNYFALSLRIGLVLTVSVIAWRPMTQPGSDRWGHSFISLAIANMNEFKLEASIDAFDDARALGAGAGKRVEQLLANGQVHDRMAEMVRLSANTRLSPPRDTLSLARALRQVPEGRAESRRLLDVLAAEQPTNAAVLRESAAWHLGVNEGAESRSLAIQELTRAVNRAVPDPSAAIMLALAKQDAAYLNLPTLKTTDPKAVRLRLAIALLASGTHANQH